MLQQLIQDKKNAVLNLESAKEVLAGINNQINELIAAPIQEIRTAQNKETGTVNVNISGILVKHILPKQIKWDQKILKETALRIKESGGNPSDYMDSTYKISEKKWAAFSPQIQAAFMPARTIKTGTAKVEFQEA